MNTQANPQIDETTFHQDVHYIESHWQRKPIGPIDMSIIDIGEGDPLVFVPILEHLEFVYAKQIQVFSSSRRVITYRRQESRTRPVGLRERAQELRQVLDSLGLERPDLVAHGDGAMVLLEFAARYPQRCRSLTIIAQAADYQIAPHPFIWLLHELYLRLPVEHFLPASFLRRTVINYITAQRQAQALETNQTAHSIPTRLPHHLIDEQFRKIALWPHVYKFSVLPIIHYYDMRQRLASLTMPILLINRADDVLSPESKTRWLAQQLPNCHGYYVVPGVDRFFMYSEPQAVTSLIQAFLDKM